jgi:hypothetical protein
MAYIGNTPAEKFSAFSKQDFTTSATTSYTLDNPVSNANEIALFINHVRQEPTTAYTAAGTALTLTSATTSSDDMYCIYLGKAVQTVNPANGSVDTAQLADSAVTNAKVASSVINSQTAETSPATGDEVLIYDTSATALRKMTKENLVKRPFAHFMHNSGDTNICDNSSDGIQLSIQYVDKEEGITVSTSNNNWTHSETGYYNLYIRYRQAAGGDCWTTFGVLKGGNSGTCVGASARTGSENNINEAYEVFYKVDSTTATYQVNGWMHCAGTKTATGSFTGGNPGWSGYADVVGTTGSNIGIVVDYTIVKVGEL